VRAAFRIVTDLGRLFALRISQLAAKFFADALIMDMANVAVPPARPRPKAAAMSRLRLMILCGRSARTCTSPTPVPRRRCTGHRAGNRRRVET